MQVEDVTGVRLAARRAAQQQGDGPVGFGLLGQVVEDDQDVLAAVHPVLADRAARVGGDVLVASRVGGGRGHDRGVRQRPGLFQGLPDAGDRRALLADGDVHAAHLALRVAGLPVGPLVDDRVDRDRGLAGLPVADDQLALATADRGHRVDRLDAGLHRLVHRLPLHHRGRLQFQLPQRGVLDRAQAVERLAQRADHPAEERIAYRDGQHLPGAAHALPFLDAGKFTEDDDTDQAYVQVQGDAPDSVLELKKLVRHGRGQALDLSDAVATLDDRADLFARDTRWLVLFDELRQRVTDLIRPDCQLRHLPHSVREYLGRPLPAESARKLAPDLGQAAGRGPVY